MEHSIEEQICEAQKELRSLKHSLLYYLIERGDVSRALSVTVDIFDLKTKIKSIEANQLAEARKALLADAKRWVDTFKI